MGTRFSAQLRVNERNRKIRVVFPDGSSWRAPVFPGSTANFPGGAGWKALVFPETCGRFRGLLWVSPVTRMRLNRRTGCQSLLSSVYSQLVFKLWYLFLLGIISTLGAGYAKLSLQWSGYPEDSPNLIQVIIIVVKPAIAPPSVRFVTDAEIFFPCPRTIDKNPIIKINAPRHVSGVEWPGTWYLWPFWNVEFNVINLTI